ncbi:MAG: molybdate ABC transporter substrate-binding protein [Raoultibacter sp.]
MKKHMRIVFAAVLAFALAGCSQPTEQPKQQETTTAPEEQHETVEMQIFAANSLTKAMDEIQELYKKDHSWVTFADTQYKSSGELNEMLAAGSEADILISASKGKMDDAEAAGYVDATTRFDMFTNDLVIVAKEGSGLKNVTLQDIADGKYTVAVGDESVPAGNYAAQALSTVGAYDDGSGKTGKDIAGTKGAYVGITPILDTSVGNVCKHAESGDVDLAIVYSSDVQRFGGVEVVGEIADNTHKPIIYPAAILTDSKVSADADEFLKWATSNEDALKVWQKWGFELA